MRTFIITTVICFIIYLLVTTGSGNDVAGLWSYIEIAFGILLSLIAGFAARTLFAQGNFWMLNPVRWFMFLGYLIGSFFVALAKANLDVAYRVITGKINPGIVRITPELKTDLGITMLTNSITLTLASLVGLILVMWDSVVMSMFSSA